MNRLWSATAMLAQDQAFRQTVQNVVGMQTIVTLPPNLQKQPTDAALTAIDALFRPRGLNLCVYDLGEINRWLDIENNAPAALKPSRNLNTFWSAIAPVAATVPAADMPGFLEAVGVVLVDRDLHARFVANTANLRSRGFSLTQAVEAQLRAAVTPANVMNAADKWVAESWMGEVCLTRLDKYGKYVHPNM